MITTVNNITEPIKIGALVVSVIALLAAGVGIMNILSQFLIEAIILCIVGGLVGIFAGVALGNIAGSFLSAQSAIPVDWVIIGITLCITVGLIFGTYPAYKAANLDPIEALRYE